MLFYLAALQSIPTDVYEAAASTGRAPGARSGGSRSRCSSRRISSCSSSSASGRLKLFDQAFIVSNGTGGPQNSTYTGVLYIYLQGVSWLRLRGRGLGRSRDLRRHLPPDGDPACDDRPGGDRVTRQTAAARRRALRPAPRSVGGRRKGRLLSSCWLRWRSSTSRRSSGRSRRRSRRCRTPRTSTSSRIRSRRRRGRRSGRTTTSSATSSTASSSPSSSRH